MVAGTIAVGSGNMAFAGKGNDGITPYRHTTKARMPNCWWNLSNYSIMHWRLHKHHFTFGRPYA